MKGWRPRAPNRDWRRVTHWRSLPCSPSRCLRSCSSLLILSRVWARTILVAAIGLVALIEPTGTLTAKGSAAANAVSRCPADGNTALAAFAVPVPNQVEALGLLGCPDPVTRLRAIAAPGNAAAPVPEAIAAIVAHLADPAGIVRQEAQNATLRNADAVRPTLLARLAGDRAEAIMRSNAGRANRSSRGPTARPARSFICGAAGLVPESDCDRGAAGMNMHAAAKLQSAHISWVQGAVAGDSTPFESIRGLNPGVRLA